MGVTAMIPGMTFQQLKDEANSRWKEIWDGSAARLDIMLLCPRKERKLLELHGDMIDHGQPVMGIFHRPRVEAELISEQGFDPKSGIVPIPKYLKCRHGVMDAAIGNAGRLVA